MPQATVTIARKDEIQPNRKTFDVKDQQGTIWKIWNDQGGLVHVGQTYEFQYKINNFKGHNFNMVDSDSIKQVSAGSTPAQAPTNSYSRPAQGKQHPDMMDLIMAVNIALKEGIRAGQVNCTIATDIANMVLAVRIGYSEGWKAPTKSVAPPSPQIDPEMNDQIQF